MFKIQEVFNAVSIFAAKKDVRYYLNGVCIYHQYNKIVHVAATDGHALAIISNNKLDFDLRKCDQTIISHDDIKKLVVMHGHENLCDYEVDSFKFDPIDGRYPDISRVIPSKTRPCAMDDGIALNMAIMSLPSKLLTKLVKGRAKKVVDHCMHLKFGSANDSIVMEKGIDELNIKIVIMPTRL